METESQVGSGRHISEAVQIMMMRARITTYDMLQASSSYVVDQVCAVSVT